MDQRHYITRVDIENISIDELTHIVKSAKYSASNHVNINYANANHANITFELYFDDEIREYKLFAIDFAIGEYCDRFKCKHADCMARHIAKFATDYCR